MATSCLWLVSAYGQTRTAPRAAPDVRVLVGDVTDKRTTGQFFAECEVELKIIGDAVADSMGLRAVRVLSAVDDTGRDLIKEDEDSSSSGSMNEEAKSSLEKTIKLKNPARGAKFIESIKGEVELLQPTVANGGVVVEKNFMARANQPLSSPGLKKWKLQVTYFTKEGFEVKKKQYEQQKEAEKSDAGGQFGKALAEAFGSIFSGFADDNDENSLRFVIDDPDGRLAGLYFRDGKGRAIDSRSHSRSGTFHSYSLEGGIPPPDSQLIIYVATPESLKVVPFKVDRIPLP
ncbi:MAG: hypothetical protein HY650_14970 [Acidobacteria bacterium]|nr:hypothetical protein [Acidobacteriota bacterium]